MSSSKKDFISKWKIDFKNFILDYILDVLRQGIVMQQINFLDGKEGQSVGGPRDLSWLWWPRWPLPRSQRVDRNISFIRSTQNLLHLGIRTSRSSVCLVNNSLGSGANIRTQSIVIWAEMRNPFQIVVRIRLFNWLLLISWLSLIPYLLVCFLFDFLPFCSCLSGFLKKGL